MPNWTRTTRIVAWIEYDTTNTSGDDEALRLCCEALESLASVQSATCAIDKDQSVDT